MKETIKTIGGLVIIMVLLFIFELGLSGEWELNQEQFQKIPTIVVRSTLITMTFVFSYIGSKDKERKYNTLYNHIRQKLSTIKLAIDDQRLTKQFGKHVDEVNRLKRLSMAKAIASTKIIKLNNKISTINRKIEMHKFKGKDISTLEQSKKWLEADVLMFSKVVEEHTDKPTKTLIFKLTKRYKPITQSSIWVQTSHTFERYDVSASDKVFLTRSISTGMVGSAFALLIISGLVFEADRIGDWKVWLTLAMTIGMALFRYWHGHISGVKFIKEIELPTRMNAEQIAKAFIEQHVITPEIKKED